MLDVRAGDVPLALGAMRGALEGRGIRPGHHVPRGARRRPHPPLLRDPPPAPAGRRAGHRQLDRAGARRCSNPVRAEADVVLDTSGPVAARAPRAALRPPGRRPGSDRLSIQLISFGFKYGVPLEADLVFDVRFMKNPYYIESLRPQSGLTDDVRDYVLGQPIAGAVPRASSQDLLDLLVPGVRRRGQDPPDHRDRLHRRLPPLDRDRPRSWQRGCASGTSARSRSSTASSSGMNLRRWLTPGIGVKRWLLVVFVGPAAAGPRVSPTCCARSRRVGRPDGAAGAIIDLLTLQFLPYPVRGLIVGVRRAWRSFLVGAYRLVRALIDPFRPVGPRPAARRGHLPEAVPRPRPADRGDRRRHRPVDAAARPQGAHAAT